jgi:hypothetical protein
MSAFIPLLCGQSSSALEFIRGPEHFRTRHPNLIQVKPIKARLSILYFAKALLIFLQSGEHDEHPTNSYRG